jgi:hypothetical protein
VPGSPSRKSFAETPEAEQLIDLKKQGDQMSFFLKKRVQNVAQHIFVKIKHDLLSGKSSPKFGYFCN